MAREKGTGSLQREKNGRYTLRVGINGKRYSRSTGTRDRDAAERFAKRFLAPYGLGPKRLPLAEVWFEYERSPNRRDLAPTTLAAKRQVWMRFARWMEHEHLDVSELGQLTSEMVSEYLRCLKIDHCATTYNNHVCALREICRTIYDKAGIYDDPWSGVRLLNDDSHSRREFTIDELLRILDAAREYDSGEPRTPTPKPDTPSHEWHTLFLIGIYTGLRLGDCCTLKWANVNLERKVIQAIPQKTRKHAHGHPVTIPIHPVLETALRKALPHASSISPNPSKPTELPKPTELSKPTKPTKLSELSKLSKPPKPPEPSPHILPTLADWYHQSKWRVSEGLKRILTAANITTSVRIEGRRHKAPEATFHSLRHTFVSLAANAGVPLTIIQSIVGHESTAMTRHYYHESESALQSAITALPTLGVESRDEGSGIRDEQDGRVVGIRLSSTTADRLRELNALREARVITEDEYKSTRARILAEI